MAKALVEDESAVLEAEESRCSSEAKLLKGTAPSMLWAPNKRADTYRAFRAAPRFVLLDFRHAPSLKLRVPAVPWEPSAMPCDCPAVRECLNEGMLGCCATDGVEAEELGVQMILWGCDTPGVCRSSAQFSIYTPETTSRASLPTAHPVSTGMWMGWTPRQHRRSEPCGPY